MPAQPVIIKFSNNPEATQLAAIHSLQMYAQLPSS
jgi:hypothetical protein